MTAPLTPDEANRAVRRLLELDDQLGLVGIGMGLAVLAFSGIVLYWIFRLDQKSNAALDAFVKTGDSASFVRVSLVRSGAVLLVLSPAMLGVAFSQALAGIEHVHSIGRFFYIPTAAGVAVSIFAAWKGASQIGRSFSSDDGTLFSGPGKKCFEDFNKRRATAGSSSMSAGASPA